MCVLIHKSNIEAEVEEVIPKAVRPALTEDLLNLVQVVAVLTELVQEEEGWEGDSSTTLGGGGEGGNRARNYQN